MSRIPEGEDADVVKELFITLVEITGLIRIVSLKGRMDEDALNVFATSYLDLCIMLEHAVADDDDDEDPYYRAERLGGIVVARLHGELERLLGRR